MQIIIINFNFHVWFTHNLLQVNKEHCVGKVVLPLSCDHFVECDLVLKNTPKTFLRRTLWGGNGRGDSSRRASEHLIEPKASPLRCPTKPSTLWSQPLKKHIWCVNYAFSCPLLLLFSLFFFISLVMGFNIFYKVVEPKVTPLRSCMIFVSLCVIIVLFVQALLPIHSRRERIPYFM